MKFPLFFAHGEEALLVFAGLILAANAISFCSVVIAMRKKKEVISRSALILSIFGWLCAIWFASLMRWRFSQEPFSWGVVLLFMLSALGTFLSLRKKNA